MEKVHNVEFFGTISIMSITECAIIVTRKCTKSYFVNTCGSLCAHTLKVCTNTHILHIYF